MLFHVTTSARAMATLASHGLLFVMRFGVGVDASCTNTSAGHSGVSKTNAILLPSLLTDAPPTTTLFVTFAYDFAAMV